MIALLLACSPEPDVRSGGPARPTEIQVLPGVPSITCSLESDRAEVHVFPAGEDGYYTAHGLLADERYRCVGGAAAFDVVTEPLPEWVPYTTVSGDPQAAESDYVLFNHFLNSPNGGLTNQSFLIADRDGRVRWAHKIEAEYGVSDVSLISEDRILYGGRGGPPRIVDLAGDLIWEWDISHAHHDVEMLPSGQVAALVYVEYDDYVGFGVRIVDPETGEDTFRFRSEDLDLDIPADDTADVFHANALIVEERHGELVRIWVNLRQTSHLIRVHPRTMEIDLQVGPETDWELQKAGGDPADWWQGPHDPVLNAGRVLLYDNGNPGDGSRIIEVDLDEDAQVATATWSWSGGWYESVWGGVRPTASGENILVARGHCTYCDAAEEGESTIFEVNRDRDVVWRLHMHPLTGLYRAESLDGCDVFANRRYCEDI